MKDVPTNSNEKDKRGSSGPGKPEEAQDSITLTAEVFIDSLFKRIKEIFERIEKKSGRFLIKAVIAVLLLILFLFVQAFAYKDLTGIFNTFSVPIYIAEGLWMFSSKKIEENLKLKIKHFPKIKRGISVILSVAIVSTALWQFPIVKATVSEVALSVINNIGEKINENSNESKDEETETTQYQEETEYNADAEFIINFYDVLPESYSEKFEEIYFYVNENDDVDSVLKHFNDIYNIKEAVKEDVEFYSIQLKEDDFISKRDRGIAYKEKNGVNEEWYKMLPNENELLDIISSQKDYAESYPSYVIFLRLSNNYQRLGDEYLRQKASNSTAKYYYYLSLLCDYECIKYAEKNLILIVQYQEFTIDLRI